MKCVAVALHSSKLWSFVQAMSRLELDCFGAKLAQYKKEFKGAKLLDKDRFRWAAQMPALEDESRRKHSRAFLTKGLQKLPPTKEEFTAYGQACLEMARGMFQLLRDHEAVLLASAIPRGVRKPETFEAEEFLRKDQVFLLERFFYFLEQHQEQGLLIMDEVEKTYDRRFVSRLERYFEKTQTGRYRTAWIVPTPFFVSSDMTSLIQVADVCIYCINWGFRLPLLGMDAPVRKEIAEEFGPWLGRLQFYGDGYRDGQVFKTYGIVFVPDPYSGK
jgi:hypothetical protein